MKWTNLVLCLILVPCVLCDCPKVPDSPRVEGYYWRDYFEDIPDDAIKVGEDANRTSIYIGQTLKDQPYGALLVGHIDSVEKRMYYAYQGNVFPVTENVKILCSPFPEDFEWTTTNFTLIRTSYQRNLVVGGYDTYPLFIGRIQLGNGAIALGKLTLYPTRESFAYIINGKATFEKPTFQVLSYKSRTKQSNSTPKCGARRVSINIFN